MIAVKKYCPVRSITEKISKIDSFTASMQRNIAYPAITKDA
jgi:hypothetical protein